MSKFFCQIIQCKTISNLRADTMREERKGKVFIICEYWIVSLLQSLLLYSASLLATGIILICRMGC